MSDSSSWWSWWKWGRRGSMDLPPDLSQLRSSAQYSLNHKLSMEQALREFNGILNEQKEASKMLENVHEHERNESTLKKVAFGACAVVAGVAAAPITGGMSLAVAEVAVGAAGVVGAGAGVGAVGSSAAGFINMQLYKWKIYTIAKKVEALVKKFLEIVEQLEKDLVKIKSLSEKLKKSAVKSVATVTLDKVKEVQKVLEQLSGSEKISGLLRRGDFVGSVGQLKSQSEQVFTKLEELRTAVEAY